MWHQWFNCTFMKLREYFLCTKKTKIMTSFKNVFSYLSVFDAHSWDYTTHACDAILLLSILLFSLYFWSDKCSLGEHKRLLSKTIGMIIDLSWEFQSCGVSGFLTSTAFLPQIFGSRACVRWRALWLPGKEGQVNTQRGQEVLQTDHLSAGLLSQSLYMVRVLDFVKISVCFIGNQNP